MDYKQAWEQLREAVDNKVTWSEERLAHLQCLRLRDHAEEEMTRLTLHHYQDFRKKMQQIEAENGNHS